MLDNKYRSISSRKIFRDRYTRDREREWLGTKGKGEEFREIEGRACTANNTGPGTSRKIALGKVGLFPKVGSVSEPNATRREIKILFPSILSILITE